MYPVHFLKEAESLPDVNSGEHLFTPPNISEQNVKIILSSVCVERGLFYVLVTTLLRDPARHAVDSYSRRTAAEPADQVPGAPFF